MSRLFEFSDQRWMPRAFRDLLTELIRHQLCAYRVYEPAIPTLNDVLERADRREVLDLCSGSGGPLPWMWAHLRAERVTLSDRYPCRRAIEWLGGVPGVAYLEQPVDARSVPRHLTACRTLFTALHHFGPADARRILESAVEAGAPIAVFEFTERRLLNGVRMLLSPVAVWRDTWAMRPRRWSRLLWTYVLPVVPLVYLWDGLVSHWRSYGPRELRALTEGLDGHAWEVGTLPPGARRDRLTYLVGIPKAPPPAGRGGGPPSRPGDVVVRLPVSTAS